MVGLTLTLGFRPKKALMGLPNGDSAGEGQLDPRSIDNKYQALVNILYVIAAVLSKSFRELF